MHNSPHFVAIPSFKSSPSQPISFLNPHFNIILPPKLWCFNRPRFQGPKQTSVYISPLRQMCHLSRPPHSLRLSNRTELDEQYKSCRSSICSFLHPPVPLRSKHLPQHPILQRLQPMFFPQRDRPSFTHIKKEQKHRYVNPFLTLEGKQQDTRSISNFQHVICP